MKVLEIPDGARYVLVLCTPDGAGGAPISVEYPEERGVDADAGIVMLAGAQETLAQRATQERRERALATLVTPLISAPEPPVVPEAGDVADVNKDEGVV